MLNNSGLLHHGGPTHGETVGAHVEDGNGTAVGQRVQDVTAVVDRDLGNGVLLRKGHVKERGEQVRQSALRMVNPATPLAKPPSFSLKHHQNDIN